MGLLVGLMTDIVDADITEDVLTAVMREIPPGTIALAAEVDEKDPETVDKAMAESGGQPSVRRSRKEVEEQLEATAKALQAAAKEATRVLRDSSSGAKQASA